MIPTLSVVIPFMNEAKSLPVNVPRVLSYLKKRRLKFELILVDDGSTDGSTAIAKRFLSDPRVRLKVHPVNRGKGAAVRTGVLQAVGKYVLFLDADLATPIEETATFLDVLKRGTCEVAIASRALPESKITKRQPWLRVMIGRIGNRVIRVLLGLPYHDTQCGYKMFTASAAKTLFKIQRFPRWSFDIEILYRAKKLHIPVCELPVTWHDAPASRVHPLRDPILFFRDVLALRLKSGSYD